MGIVVILDKTSGLHRTIDDVVHSINLLYPEEKIKIINLTDQPLEEFEEQFKLVSQELTSMDVFESYAKLGDSFNTSLSQWLEKLLQLTPEFHGIEYSRLSELNFSLPAFQEFRKIHLIRYLLKKFKPTRLLYIGDHRLGGCINELCSQHSIECKIFPSIKNFSLWLNRVFPYFRSFFLMGLNFSAELLLLLSLRGIRVFLRKSSLNQNAIGIYALAADYHWIRNDSRQHTIDSFQKDQMHDYRYTRHLYQQIRKTESVYYFLSLIRRNVDALHGYRQGMNSLRRLYRLSGDLNFEILEEYGSVADLMRAYFNGSTIFRWFSSWKRASKLDCLTWCDITIEPLAMNLFLAPLREIPKNIYTQTCSINAAKALKPKLICIPVYELLEGRAITAGFRNNGVEVIGIQHGVMHNLQIPRLIDSLVKISRTNHKLQVPNRFVVEGEISRRLYTDRGFPNSAVHVTGASRMSINPEKSHVAEEKVIKRDIVVVFGDVYLSKRLLDLSIRLSNRFSVTFKPHPSQNINEIPQEALANRDSHFLIEDYSMSPETIIRKYHPIAAICVASGVVLDLMTLGTPLIILTSNVHPFLMSGIEVKSRIPMLTTTKEILHELTRLRDSKDYRKLRIAGAEKHFDQLIASTGPDASSRLSRLVLSSGNS